MTKAILLTLISSLTSYAQFVEIPESPDTRKIYVSSSDGNDSNDGLTSATAVATIVKGATLVRDGFPDHLLLKRGDSWKNTKLGRFKSGRGINEPLVISYYGDSGDRPKMRLAGEFINFNGRARSHVWLIGLHFVAYEKDTSDPDFIMPSPSPSDPIQRGGALRFVAKGEDLLMSDCLLQHVEINLQGFPADGPDFKNFRMHRCIVIDAYASGPEGSSLSRRGRVSGIFAHRIDGLKITECVFDHNGWHPNLPTAAANQLSHNVYLQNGVRGDSTLIRNSFFTRGASHGIQARGGGLLEDNFFGKNALGFLIGWNREPLATGARAHAIRNVVSEGKSMYKGLDPCNSPGVGLCTSAFTGIDFDVNGDADYRAFDNIVSSQAPDDNQWQAFRNSLTRRALYRVEQAPIVYGNNIAYHWKNDTEGDNPAYLDPGRTLGDYHESIGGENSFESFMEVVRNRPLGTWDERYTAIKVNEYIREGFGIPTTTDTYEQWATKNSLTNTDSLPMANPDGDSHTNIIEYALNLNPQIPDPALKINIENEQSVFRYSENARISGHRIQLQISDDLATWSNLPPAESLPESTANMLQRQFTTPTDTSKFIRLQILENEPSQ